MCSLDKPDLVESVISKEHPVSGGAGFPDHVLMSLTVEATTLFDKATIF